VADNVAPYDRDVLFLKHLADYAVDVVAQLELYVMRESCDGRGCRRLWAGGVDATGVDATGNIVKKGVLRWSPALTFLL
jgi:hypothetical protein